MILRFEILLKILLCIPVIALLFVFVLRRRLRFLFAQASRLSIGFFHPHPLAGGGGERVLWAALSATHTRLPDAELVVYGDFDGLPMDEIRTRVRSQFGLDISRAPFTRVELGPRLVTAVRASSYPRFTLLLQSLGAVYAGAVAYLRKPTNAMVETGNFTCALTIPFALGARTAAYVHYPQISADMIGLVLSRAPAFNNSAVIARSRILSAMKGLYYNLLSYLYMLAAHCVHIVAANSSWTRAHLRQVWGREDVTLVFPPCPVSTIDAQVLRDTDLVVSVAQFRPEKNHMLQLDAFAALSKRRPHHGLRLVMVGGTRDEADERRAAALLRDARSRNLPVELHVNESREELRALLARASIGLHTMRDEHFGISVVELQAAGLIVVAHRSGGVAADIVDDGRTGLLAEANPDNFAERIWEAKTVAESEKGAIMRSESVEASQRFSDATFQKEFGNIVVGLCNVLH